jgi:hypothetical protein
MFGWLARSRFYLIVAVVSLQSCGGAEQSSVAVADRGPVLARVGEFELRIADVEPLARQAAELRLDLGLEVAQDDRVGLAVEFLALLHLDAIADGKKRLLARAYLDRMFAQAEPVSVSDAELQQAHREEIKKYLSTGESDMYRPTFIDATAIVVGCFPDRHPPKGDEEPVLIMEQARGLAGEIAAACGARVPDLDDFHSIARRFMSGHPTVELKEFGRIHRDPRLARMHPALHRAVTALADNGAVSVPVEVPGAVYVIRCGVTDFGKGERSGEVQDELKNRIRLSRNRSAYRERLSQLKERYRVRTWPERLRGPER